MRFPTNKISRRGLGLVAGLAVAAGVLFNLPAEAQNEACPGLQASYIANPLARPNLAIALTQLGCSIPQISSSTSSSSTTSSSTSSTVAPTTTTTSPLRLSCPVLLQNYIANPSARTQLLPLFAAFGCPAPVIPTSSSSTSSTSSTSTSSTSTTVNVASPACANLQAAYLANPSSQAQLTPILRSLGCSIPV